MTRDPCNILYCKYMTSMRKMWYESLPLQLHIIAWKGTSSGEGTKNLPYKISKKRFTLQPFHSSGSRISRLRKILGTLFSFVVYSMRRQLFSPVMCIIFFFNRSCNSGMQGNLPKETVWIMLRFFIIYTAKEPVSPCSSWGSLSIPKTCRSLFAHLIIPSLVQTTCSPRKAKPIY